MLNTIQIKYTGLFALLAALVYFVLLSKTGYLEQNMLGKKVTEMKLEVERLQVENKNLLVKQTLLKNDESILEMEARKYYLLSENAHILKFKEAEVETSPRKVLEGNTISFNLFKEKSPRNEFPVMNAYRIFYIIASLFTGIWTFFKLS